VPGQVVLEFVVSRLVLRVLRACLPSLDPAQTPPFLSSTTILSFSLVHYSRLSFSPASFMQKGSCDGRVAR
jgi:hypothetical protein